MTIQRWGLDRAAANPTSKDLEPHVHLRLPALYGQARPIFLVPPPVIRLVSPEPVLLIHLRNGASLDFPSQFGAHTGQKRRGLLILERVGALRALPLRIAASQLPGNGFMDFLDSRHTIILRHGSGPDRPRPPSPNTSPKFGHPRTSRSKLTTS